MANTFKISLLGRGSQNQKTSGAIKSKNVLFQKPSHAVGLWAKKYWASIGFFLRAIIGQKKSIVKRFF
jgi:hypothetical protein